MGEETEVQVHALFIYPVKSLAGIEVSEVALDDFGMVHDRRWMIVDGSGRFVTQRDYPQLARITTAVEAGAVNIRIPEQGVFPLIPGDETLQVVVWRDQVTAVAEAGGASRALSEYCGEFFRFVYMPQSTFRRIDPVRVADSRRVGFADGFPLLVASTASLDDLNGRLTAPVDMRRFRPNIVIAGAEPWAEDNWSVLEVGALRLRLVKPCSRCVMTTVDPDTGVKAADMQPLRTLGQFRRTADGVMFGVNAVHDTRGLLTLGDPVTIISLESD
ncbi:MAG: MOSC domain-containing protein [Marinobacter sp.]|nr:MOSC domain-containing protein [Marinobacter sp.]